jgi:hypothetical protein
MRLIALVIVGLFFVESLAYSKGRVSENLLSIDPPPGLQKPSLVWPPRPCLTGAAQKWAQSPEVVIAELRHLRVMQLFDKYKHQLYLSETANPVYWHHNRIFMPHTLALKYRIPNYHPIAYHPSYVSNDVLPNTRTTRFYGKNRVNTSLYNESIASRFDVANDKLEIANPTLARHQWDKIPSPHRFVMDGILLDKKAAQEAFHIQVIESSHKLEKPKVVVSKWKIAGVEALQLSQSYFSNWVKGGQNAIAVNSDLRVSANYKYKKFEFDNKGLHKLGIINSEGEPMRINDDLIQLSSKAGINASKNWYYSALFDFKTQLFYGRDKKDWDKILSGFMSPAYSSFALGMDYKTKDFTLLISPLTSRATFVLDTINVDPSRYSITPGKRSVWQTGASLTNSYKWKINTEFALMSNMELFYGYMNETPETQFDWELIFDMRINRFLSSRINTTYKYYQSESSKLQFKENFSVVFSYKF